MTKGHVKLGQGNPERGHFRTVCAIHQEMYDLLNQMEATKEREQLLALLAEAYDCGVRMNDKLSEYKKAKEWKPEVFHRKKK